MASKKAMKKYVDMFEVEEGQAVYQKEKTQTYFKFGLIFVVLTSIIINQRYSAAATLQSHFTTAIIAGMGVKTWYLVPEFMEAAYEANLVYSVEDNEEGE